MKTLVTIFFIFFISFTAQAKNGTQEVKINTVTETVVVAAKEENSVARVYKFKNSRIKKALSFTTKRNKAKLA